MMCIIVNVYKVFFAYTIVEAAANTCKRFQPASQLILVQTAGQSHCRCGYCILYVD